MRNKSIGWALGNSVGIRDSRMRCRRFTILTICSNSLFVPTRKVWHAMSGSVTHATFKKAQLDHLIDVILEAGIYPDHAYRCLVDQ